MKAGCLRGHKQSESKRAEQIGLGGTESGLEEFRGPERGVGW